MGYRIHLKKKLSSKFASLVVFKRLNYQDIHHFSKKKKNQDTTPGFYIVVIKSHVRSLFFKCRWSHKSRFFLFNSDGTDELILLGRSHQIYSSTLAGYGRTQGNH